MLNLGTNAKLNVKQTEDAMLRLGLDPKLSLTNATCNQLMETLKQPTCQAQQERTWESGFPVDKRVKRLTRKTQKAMEAAEIEHLFSPVKKSKKRKALTLPLSVKPTRLIVRIPLLEERGAEMATDGVDGKENNVPANCKKEYRMAMRNEAREREERGKKGEKLQRSKLIVRMPLLENKELDNSQQESRMVMRNEERGKDGDLTPNYCILPIQIHFLCAMP